MPQLLRAAKLRFESQCSYIWLWAPVLLLHPQSRPRKLVLPIRKGAHVEKGRLLAICLQQSWWLGIHMPRGPKLVHFFFQWLLLISSSSAPHIKRAASWATMQYQEMKSHKELWEVHKRLCFLCRKGGTEPDNIKRINGGLIKKNQGRWRGETCK